MDTLKRTIITIGTLGDSKVGKTALTNAYLEKEFEDEYLSTIGVN
jgi:GTPase SAR1 family protein